MKNKTTIMMTAVGTQSMPGLADCFHYNGERDICIVGADISNDPTIRQMVDVFYQVPGVYEDGYYDSLIDICRKEKVDIFFPFLDEELEGVIERLDAFEACGTKVSLPSKRVIDTTNNKLAFYEYLKTTGVYVPPFFSVQNLEQFDEACSRLGYPDKPICIKSLNGSGSRGIRILDENISLYDQFINEKPNTIFTRRDDFRKILSSADHLDPLMAMEYLPGAELSVDILADHGQILYMVGRYSEHVLASIPQETILFEDREAYAVCERIVSDLILDGNADFDFKYDSAGKPVLMEVNPRLAATLSVIAIGGINLPYLRVKQLLGEEMPVLKPAYGTRMKRRYLDMYASNNGDALFWR